MQSSAISLLPPHHFKLMPPSSFSAQPSPQGDRGQGLVAREPGAAGDVARERENGQRSAAISMQSGRREGERRGGGERVERSKVTVSYYETAQEKMKTSAKVDAVRVGAQRASDTATMTMLRTVEPTEVGRKEGKQEREELSSLHSAPPGRQLSTAGHRRGLQQTRRIPERGGGRGGQGVCTGGLHLSLPNARSREEEERMLSAWLPQKQRDQNKASTAAPNHTGTKHGQHLPQATTAISHAPSNGGHMDVSRQRRISEEEMLMRSLAAHCQKVDKSLEFYASIRDKWSSKKPSSTVTLA